MMAERLREPLVNLDRNVHFDFFVGSDGETVTGILVFSDNDNPQAELPRLAVTLTAGVDTRQQTNFVYIPKSTNVLTASAKGWPTTEHTKVAWMRLQTAAMVQKYGAWRLAKYNLSV